MVVTAAILAVGVPLESRLVCYCSTVFVLQAQTLRSETLDSHRHS